MFCFFRTTISSRRNAISPSTFHDLLRDQTLWLSARHCSSIASNRHSFTVSYLIDNFGFSPAAVDSMSKLVSFDTPEKPDSLVAFLKNQGLSPPQIRRFVREVPQSLRFDPEKAFLPKIEFLKSRGVSSSDIPKFIYSCPTLMTRSLSKKIQPSFDFLRDLLQSDDMLIKVITQYSGILMDIDTCAAPNMNLLRQVGVPESNVFKLLQTYPRSLVTRHARFMEIVQELKDLGFDPLSGKFILAVYALCSLSKSTWAKKVKAYKKWGWSDTDILVAFRVFPFCMKASEEKIDAIMGQLVKNLGCQSSSITSYPLILSMSLNKRIIPRTSVLQVLLSKGWVKKKSLLRSYLYTERDFMQRFILGHEKKEAGELLKLYQDKLKLADLNKD